MKGYEKQCNHEDCSNLVGRHGGKGYCPMHYLRYKKHGNTNVVKVGGNKRVRGILPCGVADCDKKLLQKGYCAAHYMKWYKYGDPLVSKMKPGRGRTPTVISWASMKQRCSNPNDPSKKRYIDRGIKYDPSWELFDNFVKDMGERPDGTTLDRIDNDKGYCKDNCRWANIETQANNKSSNVFITYEGETKTLMQWSRYTGIKYSLLQWRINKGWNMERVFTTKPRNKLPNGQGARYKKEKIEYYTTEVRRLKSEKSL